ncbi:MAG: NAD(P)H-hydrate dehydratase [Christensenella sp.]
MRIALKTEESRAVDRYMTDRMKIPGIVLMENAAHGVYEAVRAETEPCTVIVFCGTGNNGGDGFAAARILIANGYDVRVAVLGNIGSLKGDTAKNFEFFAENDEYYTVITNKEDFEELPTAEVYVDAIFGTGLTRDIDGIYCDAVKFINEQEALVVSVDIPSGINAETGAVMGTAVKADITVTFQYPKIGHFLYPGREYSGELQVVQIGIDEGCDVSMSASVCAYESDDADMCLGERALDSNKGSYGRLLLVAGSYGMAGAAVLAARAASRVGAGLVNVASCDDVVGVLQQNVPEATCFPLASKNGMITEDALYAIEKLVQGKTAVAIGPGLGVNDNITALVGDVITKYDLPKVIDADGLNALAGHLEFLENKKGDIILTPHPKELSRLSGMPITQILENPVKVAMDFAVEYGVTLVLKGSTTVVADAFGNTSLMCVGSPGMAKGGSGDVLTGVIAGLLTQGKDVYEAALYGVYIAGMAGEFAAEQEGEYSMTPMDTVNFIGRAIDTMLVDYISADVAEHADEKSNAPVNLEHGTTERLKAQIETPVFRVEKEEHVPSAQEEPMFDVEKDWKIKQAEITSEELEESAEKFTIDEKMSSGETEVWTPNIEQDIDETEMKPTPEKKTAEPAMDFLERYADNSDVGTRTQRRNADKPQEKGSHSLFKRGKVKVKELPNEDEITPQSVKDKVMDELPTAPKGTTRRKIG